MKEGDKIRHVTSSKVETVKKLFTSSPCGYECTCLTTEEGGIGMAHHYIEMSNEVVMTEEGFKMLIADITRRFESKDFFIPNNNTISLNYGFGAENIGKYFAPWNEASVPRETIQKEGGPNSSHHDKEFSPDEG